MHTGSNFRSKLFVALGLALLLPLAGQADNSGKPSRGEKVIMHLRVGNGSAGYHLLEAQRHAREMQRGLRKALYKVREADRVYAKSVGKPDSRYLEATTVKIATCKEKADVLEKEVKDAFRDLKDSINQTLLMGSMKK